MTDLTPDHPAVTQCFPDGNVGPRIAMAEMFAEIIQKALPHLTADDLRHTPAGRALMAEAWQVGRFDGAKFCEADHFHHPDQPCPTSPYRKETPNE